MEMCLHYLGLLEYHNLGDQNISTLKGGLKIKNAQKFKVMIFPVAKNIIFFHGVPLII